MRNGNATIPKSEHSSSMSTPKPYPVDYDDDVTADQVAAIDRLVAPEFEDGEWETVEDETAFASHKGANMTTLTAESLKEVMRALESESAAPLHPTPFNGMRVVEAHYALADSTERTFPESRNRSARIRKKLIKRFGGEFVKVPTMYQVGGVIYAHPIRYRELQAQFKAQL